MTTEEIVEHITSRDAHKVWGSACAIIESGQDHQKVEPLVKYLPLIKEATNNLNMGGGFAPNQRFVDFAIKTIEFHTNKTTCSCALFVEKYKLTNDVVEREIQYECFSPAKEVEKGNIKILDTVLMDGKWIDYYVIECVKCSTRFKVEERQGHYMFWNWAKI
jgi:hypothetical protein